MNRILKLSLAIAFTFGLLAIVSGPALASDGSFTKVNSQFSISDATHGLNIPVGSTVTNSSDGITEVIGPDNSMVLKARDSEATTILTPDGPAQATHVYELPSGTLFVSNGNVVTAYLNNAVILTVVNQNAPSTNTTSLSNNTPPPMTNSWIEDAYDTGIKADYNSALWTVPHFPVGHDASCIDYIFNAEEDWQGHSIIQPVLEWNVIPGTWAMAAWYGLNGNYYKTPDIAVSQGDTIQGTMTYENNQKWNIYISDLTTGHFVGYYMQQMNFGPGDFFGQAVYWALEGYYIQNDNDVPDTIYFSNISLTRNGNHITPHFKTEVNSNFLQLTFLSVTTSGDQFVTLHTANRY